MIEKRKPKYTNSAKRTKTKYPNVKPGVNLKTRAEELLDIQSYFNKLPEEAKEWIEQYAKENINAAPDTKNPENNLSQDPGYLKSIWAKNNARNACVWTRAKASNSANLLEDNDTQYNPEDYLLDRIDSMLFKESNPGSDKPKKSGSKANKLRNRPAKRRKATLSRLKRNKARI
jgi:hypothetical protein